MTGGSAGVRNPGYGIAPSGYRLPPSVRLGPVRLRVSDLGRSTTFYREVLGLERHGGVSGADPGGTISLGVAGAPEPLVELVERPGARPVTPRGRLGLYHFALLLPDRPSLARIAGHLLERDVRLGTADHAVSEALYLHDPDGLGVEVYADRPRRRWRTRGRELVITTDPLDLDDLLSEAGDRAFDGLPQGTVTGHVHLHVGDLDRAEAFYHEALGFDRVAWSYPGALFLSAGGYHHHLGTNVWAAGAPPAGPDDAGLVWWTLVLPDDDEVERALASVAEVDGAPSDGSVVRDPWGTAVQLVAEG